MMIKGDRFFTDYFNSGAAPASEEVIDLPDKKEIPQPKEIKIPSKEEILAEKINQNIDIIRMFGAGGPNKEERYEAGVPTNGNEQSVLQQNGSGFGTIYERPTEGTAVLSLQNEDATKVYTFNRKAGEIEKVEIIVPGKLPRALGREESHYIELLKITAVLRNAAESNN